LLENILPMYVPMYMHTFLAEVSTPVSHLVSTLGWFNLSSQPA
jgi:hypothetical protein